MTTKTLAHTTRIDVAAEARERLVPLLNASLADMIDLFSHTTLRLPSGRSTSRRSRASWRR